MYVICRTPEQRAASWKWVEWRTGQTDVLVSSQPLAVPGHSKESVYFDPQRGEREREREREISLSKPTSLLQDDAWIADHSLCSC
jgi:hypothetical protein